MKRLLALAAVFSLLVAACSGTDDVVASVNGEDIVHSQVEMLAPETDDDSFAADFTRYLSVVIQWKAISQAAAADHGIEPTAEEIDARLDELVAGQGQGATLEDYLAQVNASEDGIRQFAEQLIIQDAIQAVLGAEAELISDEVVNDELLNNPLTWTVVCASHILVETEDEAVAVMARLDAGEEFAVVAQEVSIDSSTGPNGGDLGCSAPVGFVEGFATGVMEAEIDVATGPVESEFGFHAVLVTQREEATSDVVQLALQRDALAAAVDDWFLSVIEDADVSVPEDVGVWVTEPTPQVLTVN